MERLTRMSFNPVTFRPRRSNRETISPMSPRCTASGFRRTKVRSATSGPLLRLPCGRSGRLLFLGRFAVASLDFLPPAIEPGLERASPLRGIFPGEELRLVDAGDGFGAMLLLRPSNDRRAERIARHEVRILSLEVPAREVWAQPLVDQVGQIRRDVLSFRSFDCDLDRKGLGRRSFLGDRDGLFGDHAAGGSPERLGPRRPPWHAPELQHVRLALVRTEQEDGPVFSDEHLARAGLDLVAAERARAAGRHRLTRPRACGARRPSPAAYRTRRL